MDSIKRVDIPKTQSVMAVIFAPITGAIAIAIVAFNYTTSISHWSLGALAGLGSFLGIEAIGGACCYALIKCHRERDYGADFWTALAGVIAYIGGGILTLHLQSPIVIFFALSPFAYFSYSIIRTMQEEIAEKTKETEAQTALIKAQTNLTNAQTRKEKAQQNRATPSVQNVQNNVLNDVNAARQAEKLANLDRVKGYLVDNPNASLSEIGEFIGKGKSTAKNYTSELEQSGVIHKNGEGWKVN